MESTIVKKARMKGMPGFWKKIRPRQTALLVLAALVSRTELFGEIMPFGAALYAAEYIHTPPYATSIIAILATVFPTFMPMASLRYALSILLFSILMSKKGNVICKSPVRRGAAMAGCVFLSGMGLLLCGQILMYDCFALVLESGITFGSVCLFANAKKSFLRGTTGESPLAMLSASALCGIAVLGVGNLFSLCGLHVTASLMVLTLLLLSHKNGLTAGAIAGITLGLLATFESGNPVLGAFAAAGMAAGYFSRYGKAGASVAFIVANSVITFYTGGTAELVLNLYEILAPTIIYLAIPHSFISRTGVSRAVKGQEMRMKGLIAQELSEKADAFSYLANVLSDISEHKLCSTNAAASVFFDRAVRKACEGCHRIEYCWKKEFNRTYAAFFVLLEICNREGQVTDADVPISLSQKCMRREGLPMAFNHMYEVYKVDKLWEGRVMESRAIVTKQLAGMAEILREMNKKMKSDMAFSHTMEEMLRTCFMENNVPVYDISVIEKKHGQMTVHLYTDKTQDMDRIAILAGTITGDYMESMRERDGHIRLTSVQSLCLLVGGCGVSKEKSPKSGDSYDSLYMDSGAYLLAISDGMGSGERAGRDSRATINMLKTLLSAGFDTDTAIGLVNSVLVLKSAEDAFATIDLALINTRSGNAEFIKVGAADSFIKHGEEVRLISSGTLPAGMLGAPDVARFSTCLVPGDMIIMLTDGVADADRRNGDTGWIVDIIRAYTGVNPHELSQKIMEAAKKRAGNKIADDMTVLSAIVRSAEKAAEIVA